LRIHDVIKHMSDAISAASGRRPHKPIPYRRSTLDVYCARIGYRGPRTPTLETLRALHELHPAAIAFEAFDVLLDRGIDLSPAAIDAKLIGAGRGGYCFEHNRLFKRVMAAISFEVEGLSARVRWMRPVGTPPLQRTHMALQVTADGERWLVDVGFGGCVPTAPQHMERGDPQPTAHETFRIVGEGGSRVVEALRGEAWLPLYELLPEPQLDIDYELANWFTASDAGSPLRRNLIVARATLQARDALLD
jgi:N-hydroxyarylamine O-acetyltransferase